MEVTRNIALALCEYSFYRFGSVFECGARKITVSIRFE
jgi:hypothetical protein